jgi:GNAT superfamily N-acetyltransferase
MSETMMEEKWEIRERIDEFILRNISDKDSYEEITGLLHLSYRPLLENGMRYWASHQGSEVTKDRIENGVGFVLVDGENRVRGTITYYPPGRAKGCDWYDRKEVSTIGQFGLHPSIQKRRIGSRIMDSIENLARRNGVRIIALDTSEKATDLIDLYRKRGYQEVRRVHWDGTNYKSIILSLEL